MKEMRNVDQILKNGKEQPPSLMQLYQKFTFFKIWSNVLHLLHDCIPPKSVLVKIVNLFCPLHILRYLNTVFVSLNPVFKLNLGKDAITLL